MTQDILEEILTNAKKTRFNPADVTKQGQNALVQNLLEIGKSHRPTAEKKTIVVKAIELSLCSAVLPELIKQTQDENTKEMFAEIALDYVREKRSSFYTVPFVKDTELPADSPARKAMVQVAIDCLPLAKSNQDFVANAVIGICETFSEEMAATDKIREIVQSMDAKSAHLFLMQISSKKIIKSVMPSLPDLPALERIEILKEAFLSEGIQKRDWLKRELLYIVLSPAISELDSAQAVKTCIEINKDLNENIYEKMDPNNPGYVNEHFIGNALQLLEKVVPEKDKLEAARNILFSLPDYSDYKDSAAYAYIVQVEKLGPKERLAEAKIIETFQHDTKFNSRHDAVKALITTPHLLGGTNAVTFREVEEFMSKVLLFEKNAVVERYMAPMAIKAIQTEEPEVRFYNLTSIADRFREDGIRNKILVEAVKYLEFVPRNKQFGAAFVLASNYKLLTPAGETDVIPAREEGLKAAFGAIKHLPKTKRAEAARELFEAATDLPDLRAAIVKRHGKSLPNGGQPMSVADFLNAKIG